LVTVGVDWDEESDVGVVKEPSSKDKGKESKESGIGGVGVLTGQGDVYKSAAISAEQFVEEGPIVNLDQLDQMKEAKAPAQEDLRIR
jgi:hypothetical protein